jgi:hypothetical protein
MGANTPLVCASASPRLFFILPSSACSWHEVLMGNLIEETTVAQHRHFIAPPHGEVDISSPSVTIRRLNG